MIIRIQSAKGVRRIEVGKNESLKTLYSKANQLFDLSDCCKIYGDRNKTEEIPKTSATVVGHGLNHGDMLYMYVEGGFATPASQSSKTPVTEEVKVVEDEIDQVLWKENGRIKREGSENSGVFKMEKLSIEPWDEGYLREKKIKFLSFHAYMRQQTAGADKGKYFRLQGFKAASKVDASNKTVYNLPSAVTLNSQKFRFVDNIVFENKFIVDRFLNYWRSNGHQRMAFLYGRYVKHPDVPLGIRAEICALYEPPQGTSQDKVTFEIDSNSKNILADKIANKMGLQKIGWIITDLAAMGKGDKFKNFRNSDTHFLSAEECITAAHFQNLYPNPCRLASDGTYGSKFVTVVVSGDKENLMAFEGYQVSTQCMSLVADGCLVPTLDAPELGYIKESSPELFVADVYYKEKDKYGNQVQKLAQPLPLEYLLTDVPTAFTRATLFTASNETAEFPACNREFVGQTQTIQALNSYLKKFSEDKFIDAISDFNVLFFLAKNPSISLLDEMDMLFEAVRAHDNDKALDWCKTCSNWETLQMIMAHSLDESAQSSSQPEATMDAEMMEAIQRSLQQQ